LVTCAATRWRASSPASSRPCSASRCTARARSKAAHLLYFVIKDHPFSDGNKRIGSFLFLLYLQQEGITHALNPAALTALALLVAENAPTAKDLMVRLIMNLLMERAA
jgi:fido (protein-threonine AMPylation protein)